MNISEMPRTRLEGDATALNGRSRLVMKSPEPSESLAAKLLGATQPSGIEPNCGMPDPLIQALVDRLPKPNTIWSIDDRAKWLRAAATLFNLVYKADDCERKEPSLRQTAEEAAIAPSVSSEGR